MSDYCNSSPVTRHSSPQTHRIANQLVVSQGINLNRIPGFSIFEMLDATTAAPLLTIQGEASLSSWEISPLHSFPFENDEVICDFACNGDTYLFRMRPPQGAPYLMEIRQRGETFLAQTNMNAQTPAFLLRFACWMAFGIAALHRSVVAVHASVVSYAGASVLFLGESGTGKSTHTRLWLRHIAGAELLNDDSPCIQVNAGGVLAHGFPWSGKTPCFKDAQAPVAAMVRLSQAPRNEITRLKGIRALAALLPSCPPAFAYHTHLAGLIHNILDAVLQQVAVYHLACLPDAEAAQLVLKTLQEDKCL